MSQKSPIIWLTGMSGAGKSTIANCLKEKMENKGCFISIIDGDSIRDNNEKLGFGFDDVRINNMRISSLCDEYRAKFDLVIVPVISPYEEIRQEVRSMLEPNFHLVFLQTDIVSLKNRDPKGLYAAADRGDIEDLIGYSAINPYDVPNNPELIVPTGNDILLKESTDIVMNYINKIVLVNKCTQVRCGL
jgi:adenylylsulfate kinase